MAEMLIQSESLTALADKIRVLKGTTESMSLDKMEVELDIPKNDSGDLTASGATVAVPSGYYATQATKSVDTATQATPSISVDSAGKITATATQTAGYVAAGTKSSTHQLAFQPAKTITPTTASQIAVSSGYYTGGNVTVAGDSNLVADNIKSGVSIFGVSGNYVGSGGGDTSVEDGLVNRTMTSFTNSRVTSIGSYAFYYCSRLTSVSFPAATSIGSLAFNSCTSLTSVSFPVATYIGSSAFRSCTSLTSVSFPAATSIGSYAFEHCSRLTSVSFPVVTYIDNYAFCYCSSLTSVSFPVTTYIGGSAFAYCSKLSTIRLGASSICTLSNSKAFYTTSIWSNKGSIYVPSSLVESYKAATNWAFFSARIYSA